MVWPGVARLGRRAQGLGARGGGARGSRAGDEGARGGAAPSTTQRPQGQRGEETVLHRHVCVPATSRARRVHTLCKTPCQCGGNFSRIFDLLTTG